MTTISSAVNMMNKLAVSNQQSINLTKVINNNYKLINNTLNQTLNVFNIVQDKQEKLNEDAKKGSSLIGGMVKKVFSLKNAYSLLGQTQSYLNDSWLAANERIRAEQRLQTIMSHTNGMTQDGINFVKQRAVELEKTTTISAGDGISGQAQLAKYVNDPTNIANLTESMYDLAAGTYGAKVNSDQLMKTADLLGKAMQGDIGAIAGTGIKIESAFTEAQKAMFLTSTEAERAAMVIQLIEENVGGLASAIAETPEGAVLRLANAWDMVQQKIGFGLLPIIMMLTDFITDNMPFIEDIFTRVFDVIFKSLTAVFEVAASIVSFIISNWPLIEPVIWGIVAAMAALLVVTNWNTIALTATAIADKLVAVGKAILTAAILIQAAAVFGLRTAWQALSATMKANVIMFVVTLIIGLITWLVRLWQTNDNFAAGFMRVWNTVLNFFDQTKIRFAQIFIDIVNFMNDMEVKGRQILQNFLNAIYRGIGSLVEGFSKLTGIELPEWGGTIDLVTNTANIADKFRQESAEYIAKLEGEAADKAAKREQKVLDMLNDRAAKREKEEQEREARFDIPPLVGEDTMPTGAWDTGEGRLPIVDKVGEVGKINDTVDISSEDLKTMRELAEMKNIQNFVTLTPQMTFGDTHVRQDGRSVDEIVSAIATRMEQEMAASASGIYAV